LGRNFVRDGKIGESRPSPWAMNLLAAVIVLAALVLLVAGEGAGGAE
jgi:hypothetical protein